MKLSLTFLVSLLCTTIYALPPDTLKIGNTTFLTDINTESARIWIVKKSGNELLLEKDLHGYAREEFDGYCFKTSCTISNETLIFRSERLEWDEIEMSQVQFDEEAVHPGYYVWSTETYLLRDWDASPMRWIDYDETRKFVDMRYTSCPQGY